MDLRLQTIVNFLTALVGQFPPFFSFIRMPEAPTETLIQKMAENEIIEDGKWGVTKTRSIFKETKKKEKEN